MSPFSSTICNGSASETLRVKLLSIPQATQAQMIASGWQILLDADGGRYEYRADKYQLRLYDFEGENYLLDVE